jgi:hypothetical protein
MTVTDAFLPSYVPSGFRLRNVIHGREGGGFPADPEQVTYVYAEGWARSNFVQHMSLNISAVQDASLGGTEHRRGVPVDVGAAGVRAVYHDGQWHADPAVVRTRGLAAGTFWSTADSHSVTVHDGDRTYGIRAGVSVSAEELIKVARSLPFAR